MIDAIVVNSRPDTDYYPLLTQGLDANVLVNPSGHQIKELLRASTNDLILFGHGTELGLLNRAWNGYSVGRRELQLLRTRRIIGLWCYAGNFADRYGLHGFFTSMFISNQGEAVDNCFVATQREIDEQNVIFAKAINKLLADQTPMDQWVGILQDQCANDIPFVRFNYEALAYYE